MISLSHIVDLSVDTSSLILFRECSFVNCSLVGFCQLERCVVGTTNRSAILGSVNESSIEGWSDNWRDVFRVNSSSVVYTNSSYRMYAFESSLQYCVFREVWIESCSVHNIKVLTLLVCSYTRSNITLSYIQYMGNIYSGSAFITNSTIVSSPSYTQTFFPVLVPSVFSRVPSLLVSECHPIIIRVFVPVFAFLACLLFE